MTRTNRGSDSRIANAPRSIPATLRSEPARVPNTLHSLLFRINAIRGAADWAGPTVAQLLRNFASVYHRSYRFWTDVPSETGHLSSRRVVRAVFGGSVAYHGASQRKCFSAKIQVRRTPCSVMAHRLCSPARSGKPAWQSRGRVTLIALLTENAVRKACGFPNANIPPVVGQ